MVKYTIELIKKHDVAEKTTEFYFKKPEGFTFKAGQFADFTIPNPSETDAEGNTRAFSFSSAPFESHIMVATRMRDTAFKRVLSKMSTGSQLTIEGPFGSFTLQNDTERPAVFLIGGIGITPIFSIIKQASHNNTNHNLYLFYANRDPKSAAFIAECQQLQKENKKFTFIPTMTKVEEKKIWDGETGYINKELISKYVKEPLKPIYYLAGPAKMVQSMRELLTGLGVNEDNIRTEEFTGY